MSAISCIRRSGRG